MLQRVKELTGDISPVLKKIAGNSGWLFTDKIIRLLTGFFVWVWIARYLGPAQFGIFNYAIALVALLTPLATLGLDNIVVRDLVKLKEKAEVTLGSAFFLKVAGSILTVCISLAVVMLLKPEEKLTQLMVIIIAAGTLFQSVDVIDFFFQSEVKSKYSVIAKDSAFLISSVLKVLLIVFNYPLIAFAWISLFEMAAGAAGLMIAYKVKEKSIFQWRIHKSRIKELLKDCIPLALSSSAILFYMRIDIILLGEISGDKEVGIYSAATRISELFYFLSTILSTSSLPVLLENPELFNQRLKKIFDAMALISYLVVIPVFILSPFIIKIFGSEYSSAVPVLAVHTWATIFVFTGVAQGSWYLKEGSKGLYLQLRRTITGAVMNIILNIILIPGMGGLGAAIATLISYAYVGYFSNILNEETREIFKLQTESFLLQRFFKKRTS